MRSRAKTAPRTSDPERSGSVQPKAPSVGSPDRSTAAEAKRRFLAEVPKPSDDALMALYYRGREAAPAGTDVGGAGVVSLAVSAIDADPGQPRQTFDETTLHELARSIEAHGQLQPVLVRRDGERLILIAGERRWRACKLIGKTTIDARILDVDPLTAFQIALAENVQRDSLLPLDEARAYQRLLGDLGGNQGDVARRLGIDHRRVGEKLSLLRLPLAVQRLISDQEGGLTESHARFLASAPDEVDVTALALKSCEMGWSVRALRRALRGHGTSVEPHRTEVVQLTMNRHGGFLLRIHAVSQSDVGEAIEALEKTLCDLRARLASPPTGDRMLSQSLRGSDDSDDLDSEEG